MLSPPDNAQCSPEDKEPTGASVEHYVRLLNSLDSIIWEGYSNPETGQFTFTFVSDHLLRLLGYRPGLWIKDAGEWIKAIHEEDRSWVPAACMQASRDEENHVLEYRMVSRDGKVVWVRDSVTFLEKSGSLCHVSGFMLDISEHKRTEAELIAAKKEAEEMNRLKSTFLSNMSHEIRTPLSSIIGFSEILADDFAGEGRELVNMIQSSSVRLMETLNSVLDLAQLESQSIKFTPQLFDVARMTNEAVMIFQGQADAKGIRLTAINAEGPLWIESDRGIIWRILSNLVSNSIKFTEQGAVTISLQRNGDNVAIAVSDTGIGISSDFLPRLFDEFTQASSGTQRVYDGNGLGLHITKRLVDLARGSIRVDSTPGQGTCFTVNVPGVANSGPLPIATESAPSIDAKPAMSALIVDDNEESLWLIDWIFRERAETVLCATADETLAEARQRIFDVVILDIQLGGKESGTDLLKQLRKLPGYDAVPAIACTAQALPGEREKLLAAGFDAYVSKPFTRKQLLRATESVLVTE
jgi:PAS domain S-box-containing protein